ncbi:hypothetical protein Hanom_Chr07g00601621 [Helianthus anomalus]
MLVCHVMFAYFFYRDYFPLIGWLEKLNGSIARLEKTFKDMDEFYQEVIDGIFFAEICVLNQKRVPLGGHQYCFHI